MSELQIIIAGGTSTGKTTVARMIANMLDREDITVVINDDGRDDLRDQDLANHIKCIKALSWKELSVKIQTVQLSKESHKGTYKASQEELSRMVKISAELGIPYMTKIQRPGNKCECGPNAVCIDCETSKMSGNEIKCDCAHDRACEICYSRKMEEFKKNNASGSRRSAVLTCSCKDDPNKECGLCIANKSIADARAKQKIKCVCVPDSGFLCSYCHNRMNKEFDPMLGALPCPDGVCACDAIEVCQICMTNISDPLSKPMKVLETPPPVLRTYRTYESREDCPDCDDGKLHGAPGGGVKCDKCNYSFCF